MTRGLIATQEWTYSRSPVQLLILLLHPLLLSPLLFPLLIPLPLLCCPAAHPAARFPASSPPLFMLLIPAHIPLLIQLLVAPLLNQLLVFPLLLPMLDVANCSRRLVASNNVLLPSFCSSRSPNVYFGHTTPTALPLIVKLLLPLLHHDAALPGILLAGALCTARNPS